MDEINTVLTIAPSWAGLRAAEGWGRQRDGDAAGSGRRVVWQGRGAHTRCHGSLLGLPAAALSWGPGGVLRKAGKYTMGSTLGV